MICFGDATNCPTAYFGGINNTLSGYAWSNHIGWINFGANSCGATPTINGSNALSGWAKAVSTNGNGWDGCISLSGTGYGAVINGTDTYAWGSDVVGWVDFSGVTLSTYTQNPIGTAFNPNFTATPSRVRKGGTTYLTWDASATMASCGSVTTSSGTTVPGSNKLTATGTQVPAANITNSTIFTLACTNGTATSTAQTTVGVGPVFKEI